MLRSLQNIIIIADQQHLKKVECSEELQSNIQLQKTNPKQFVNLIQLLLSHRNNLKAIEYYRKIIKKKVLKSLQNNVQINDYLRIIQKYFLIWKFSTLSTNIQNKILKNRVFDQLRKNKHHTMIRNLIKVRIMTADNCYERCLKAKVFGQWKFFQQAEKKSGWIIKNRKKKQLKFMISICSIRKQQKLTKNLAKSISNQKVVKRYFNEWLIWCKTRKIQKKILHHQSIIFLPALNKYRKTQQTLYQKYYDKALLNRCYKKIKINMLNARFDRYYRIKIIKKYLNNWISAGSRLFYQKQKYIKNQQVLLQYLDRKSKVQLRYYLERWKKYVDDRIEDRKKNDIAKQYGQVKQKQYLLRKYFNVLIQNKKYSHAQKFNASKLKLTVMNGLKAQIINSSSKLESVCKFVERRERKKYFDALIIFNKQEKHKVYKHLMGKYWNFFTLGIVREFVSLNKKAENYHQEILKYKAFFILKDALVFKSKINKVIIFINANLNIRRWRKYHRVRQFIQTKKFIILTQVFRQLKLLRLNKIWSQAKIESTPQAQTEKMIGLFYKANQTTPQSSIYFQRMNSDSPSKLFSLEYSISAYNSNNNYQQY